MYKRQGAIECETLKILNKSGDFRTFSQDMSPWGAEQWSNGHQLTFLARKAGEFVELEVTAPSANARQIVLHATQAPDYGTLKFTINGQPVAETLDGYAPTVQPAAPLKLGTFTPENNKFILRAEVTGTNPASKGARYFFGLDCVLLNEVP